jgi:hypothetical protein
MKDRNEIMTERPILPSLILSKRDEIRRIAGNHGAKNLRIFGPVARGEAGLDKGLDLLVDKGRVTSAWFPTGLIQDLEHLLGCPVEIVTEQTLKPDIHDQVIAEAVPL